MKETKKMWSLWKKSVKWDEKTIKQKLISVWFSLSFIVLGICGDSNMLFMVLAVANFGTSAYCCVKYVPINEEVD